MQSGFRFLNDTRVVPRPERVELYEALRCFVVWHARVELNSGETRIWRQVKNLRESPSSRPRPKRSFGWGDWSLPPR